MTQEILPPLFCKIGDTVEFTRDLYSEFWDDEEKEVKIGDKYKTVNLIGSGWDLQKVTGEGPEYLRIINSEMKDYVKVLRNF